MLAEMGARGELALSERAMAAIEVGGKTEAATEARGEPASPQQPGRRKRVTRGSRQQEEQPISPASTARQRDAVRVPLVHVGDAVIPLVDPAAVPAGDIAFRIPDENWTFIARNPIVLHVVEQLRTVAPLEGTVLLLGETGTGKEMLARLVHAASGRRGSFIAANASAFPESLVESELFGHIRGAFTGAGQDKKGLFEAANGGTFFLDEVGDLPLATQAKLLRTLEERAVKRVGATETRRIDVRFVAATNLPLRQEMETGRFRRDLYYRLSAHEFEIPPLRKRGEDVLLLARHILARRAVPCGKRITGIASDAACALLAYAWPGNVRELDNEMQRAATIVPDGAPLEAAHLSARIRAALEAAGGVAPTDSLVSDVAQLERTRIESALAATGGTQARAAALLGMSRQALRYKLIKYDIKPRRRS
jgi:transcriptional regulator with PAS, ATPase and Fis domain